MDKVNLTEILACTWDCPCCGAINIQDALTITDKVLCDDCMQEFKVGKIKEMNTNI